MKMDRRKSSLVYGSRTGKHILKGKHIRINEDGVHNFDDYFTDSGSETTEESICPSEGPQAQQSPSISSAVLATSRQSVRKSKNSDSRTEISDKLDRTKSPLKRVKRSSTSNVNSIRGNTENTAVSQNRETNDEVVNIIVTQNNDESSENVDKEECIRSRTFRNSCHSVRDQSTFCPILHNSEKVSGFGNRTVRKTENSLKMSKKFAKYDEYDAEIMQMIRQNEQNLSRQNLRRSETFFSVVTNPVEEKKTKSIASKKPFQSTEESSNQMALKRGTMNSKKSQNSHNVRSSNKVQAKSQLKSSEFRDGIIKELSRNSTVTKKGNSEVNISLTSQHSRQSQTEDDLSSDSEKTFESPSKVDENRQLTAEERSLRSKSSAIKSPLKRNSTVMSITSAKKHCIEHQNMPRSRLNISAETSPRPVREKGKTLEYLSEDKINNASKIPRVKDKTLPSLDNKKKKHLKEENENIPEMCDSDELELSTGKKKNKKKTAVSSDSVPFRRSSRQKFPVLARWRQERLQFRVENGINNFVGIDPGTGEDDGAIKQMLKRKEKQTEAKERKTKEHQRNPRKPKNFELYDVVQEKKVCVPVVKKFHDIPWDKEYRRDECPYRVKKLFQTVNSACGFIQIETNEKKPLMYMPEDELCLTVMKGKVQATIQDNIFIVGDSDMLMIPRYITYSLKNVGLQKALLAFYVGKFQYLESQA